MTAVCAALLTALIVARATRRIRLPSREPRRGGVHLRRPGKRKGHQDYASMLTAIARQVRSGASLTAALIDEVQPSTPLADIVVERCRTAHR